MLKRMDHQGNLNNVALIMAATDSEQIKHDVSFPGGPHKFFCSTFWLGIS